jgi:hypothetical protein
MRRVESSCLSICKSPNKRGYSEFVLEKTSRRRRFGDFLTLFGILLQIIARAIQAYDHTGETLDPSLIKPEQVL